MRRASRASNVRAGLLMLAAVGVAVYFAFTQSNPFDHPFTFSAAFSTAENLHPGSPVRIAGVDVGKVESIRADPTGAGAAMIRMEIRDAGLPLHRDLRLKIRPRIFLEGNDFVDVSPGTPAAPALSRGAVVPLAQTAVPVQIDQILDALRSDTRRDLKTFLREYGTALRGGGAEAYARSIAWQGPAYRDTAIADEASLGTAPGDLWGSIAGTQRVAAALARHESTLAGLVTDADATFAAFADRERALRAALPAFARLLRTGYPALADVQRLLPALRGFARDALPGVRSALPATEASIPFLAQARGLLAPGELGGLARDLHAAVPALTRANGTGVGVLDELRLGSSCEASVLIPWAEAPIPHPNFPDLDGQPFYKQIARALVGLAGESRISDANGPIARIITGSGATTLTDTGPGGQTLFAQAPFPLRGTRPAKPPAGRTPFRPGVPCETQDTPDLNAPLGDAGGTVTPHPVQTPANRRREARAHDALQALLEHLRALKDGTPTVDPLLFGAAGMKREAARRGIPVARLSPQPRLVAGR